MAVIVKAQLATNLDPGRLMDYLDNPDWWLDQKVDGHRLLVTINESSLTGVRTVKYKNRTGHQYSKRVPSGILLAVRMLLETWNPTSLVLDGELVDGRLWLFDLPTLNGMVTPDTPYEVRHDLLGRLMQDTTERIQSLSTPLWGTLSRRLGLLTTATEPAGKKALALAVLQQGGEGVVLKRRDAPYRPGQRSPDMLKVKFTNTAEVIVSEVGREGKESLRLHAYRDGELVEVGACSSIGKEPVSVGDVIEVRYLYLGADERLVQPRMLRRREDKHPSECGWDQFQPVNKEVITP